MVLVELKFLKFYEYFQRNLYQVRSFRNFIDLNFSICTFWRKFLLVILKRQRVFMNWILITFYIIGPFEDPSAIGVRLCICHTKSNKRLIVLFYRVIWWITRDLGRNRLEHILETCRVLCSQHLRVYILFDSPLKSEIFHKTECRKNQG